MVALIVGAVPAGEANVTTCRGFQNSRRALPPRRRHAWIQQGIAPMDRAAAERVFELVADLRGDLRERLVHERWWLVWIVTGLQIPITNALTQLLIRRNETRAGVYIALWSVQVLLVPITIRLIHRRTGGRRSNARPSSGGSGRAS
jgi:hypothetical protein